MFYDLLNRVSIPQIFFRSFMVDIEVLYPQKCTFYCTTLPKPLEPNGTSAPGKATPGHYSQKVHLPTPLHPPPSDKLSDEEWWLQLQKKKRTLISHYDKNFIKNHPACAQNASLMRYSIRDHSGNVFPFCFVIATFFLRKNPISSFPALARGGGGGFVPVVQTLLLFI